MHGDAVHADLNGVSCRPVRRTVTEVQLDGLHCMDGRSEARKETILLGQQGFFQRIHAAKLFGANNSLVQYVKQLVDYILTEEVSRL